MNKQSIEKQTNNQTDKPTTQQINKRTTTKNRDLKNANVLLDENYRCHIADFGLAKMSDATISSENHVVGTWPYLGNFFFLCVYFLMLFLVLLY
jgi:serine/threonine protein kinase